MPVADFSTQIPDTEPAVVYDVAISYMKLFVGAKALLARNGKILILREASTYVEGTELGKWDVPGGRIESEEPLRDGLKREVFEECGIAIQAVSVLDAHEGFPTIRGEKCHIVRIYFKGEAGDGEVILSKDHDQFLWIDPQEHRQYPLMEDLHEVFEVYNREPL